MRHIPVDQVIDLGGVRRVIGVDGKLGLRGDQNTLFVVLSAASEPLVLSLGKTALLPIISAGGIRPDMELNKPVLDVSG
jgi:hypothetical protein